MRWNSLTLAHAAAGGEQQAKPLSVVYTEIDNERKRGRVMRCFVCGQGQGNPDDLHGECQQS